MVFWHGRFPPCTILPKKRSQNAGFGPAGDKKVTLLQSAFQKFPRNPMMLWN
jgi:hypothetical protein